MSSAPRLQVIGLEAAQRGMSAAAGQMADLSEPEAASYALIAASARRRSPRRTGALAASIVGGAAGAGVTASASYAVPVHWGTFKMRARPFIWEAAEATEGAWTEVYGRHADKALDRAAT